MNEITHEGKTYILKSDMENAISNRIQKIAGKASDAEARAQDLQAALDEASARVATVDTIAAQLDEAKKGLELANARYERHTTISKFGLTDNDMLEAVEWQYNRAMQNVEKKDQVQLSDWLQACVEAPQNAPALLRPHLQALNKTEATVEAAPPTSAAPAQPVNAVQQPTPPALNTGATAAPARVDDILTRGGSDFDFYQKNRDNIINAWRNRNKHGV